MRVFAFFLSIVVSFPALVKGQALSERTAGSLGGVLMVLLEDDLPCSGRAPAGNLTFVPAPYRFSNASLTSADPKSSEGGTCVVWVDQQNLDNSDTDFTPDPSAQNKDNFATRDIFFLNTLTGSLTRVTDPKSANLESNSNVEAASPAISDDGRFVAYVQERPSTASESNTLTYGDVYVRDMGRPTSAPTRVNIAVNGANTGAGIPLSNETRGGSPGSRANESLQVIDISGNGDKVAFITNEPLAVNDTNASNDVYVRDLRTKTTSLVSLLNGSAGGSVGTTVRLSNNGRYVAFSSTVDFTAGELSISNPSDSPDIYLMDTNTGNVLLVSSPVSGLTGAFDMSSSGSRIAFSTLESIDPNDSNNMEDIYVANINLNGFAVSSRQRVNQAEGGFEVIGGDSYAPSISPDGTRVAFVSQAKDLAPYRLDYLSRLEQSYIVELSTGAIFQPDALSAVGQEKSLISHVALAKNTFYYREQVPVVSGNVSDTISSGVAERAANRLDVGTIEVEHFQSIRGVIDSASDVDIYRIKGTDSAESLEVAVTGVDSGAGTLTNPQVRVLM